MVETSSTEWCTTTKWCVVNQQGRTIEGPSGPSFFSRIANTTECFMGIGLDIINHDEVFKNLKKQPIMLNDYDLEEDEDRERLKGMIYVTYNSDSLEILPSCDCGELSGEEYNNLFCDHCGSYCLPVTERPLESTLWIRAPQGIKALINPHMWKIMEEFLSVSRTCVMSWLTDPYYKPPKTLDTIEKFKRAGIPRGLNAFYDNFDQIMHMLFREKFFTRKVQQREGFYEFIKMHRNFVFSQHIPVPSKLAFITEETPTGRHADPDIRIATDAVMSIVYIENELDKSKVAKLESETSRAIKKFADYYDNFYRNTLSKKPGIVRKHIVSSRAHFSFRAVISSLHEAHHYQELHLPWGMSVMFLEKHLMSKLRRMGYTAIEAHRHIREYTLRYSPVLDRIFQELIAESPTQSIPCLLQRN